MAIKKLRLDELLVESGEAENRSKAKAMVMAGIVFSGNERLDKAGSMLPIDTELRVKGKAHPFASRGGLKLQKACEYFGINPDGKKTLDVGASTGGFTDYLLQNGASQVTAVDVGHGQLDWKLRNDKRVKVLEKFNAREMTEENLGTLFDIVTIDVSFISLTLLLKPASAVTVPSGYIIALVKPQFEAGKKEADRYSGVIKDEKIQRRVVNEVESFGISLGLTSMGCVESPITGAKGNREFLLAFCRTDMK